MLAFAPFLAVAVLALNVLAERNTAYPACDTPVAPKVNKTVTGVALPFEISDDTVFYVVPGLGSCGVNYTDTDLVACLAPGWMGSAYHSHCGSLIAVADPETGKQVIVKALDTCGAAANTTFGCNDIYLSKTAFEDLGGNTTLGRLTSNITWNFIANDTKRHGKKCE
ncbi:unnamed protein product [Tilletia laevis]|uniref:Uncharacterized protein n=2 Tax=Tilletia TaxID=13289 RepID=A0A8X7MS39_9BASI|nr:hypothetical protein CF336_g5301 [Tilletia laevis]KAE8193882.1 hypothetical protein CF328_g4911 [Tilletia controversa]KAE8256557.1 hypothetical protein A4X03_0g5287 [Tilletia caries]KAE8246088.1 hypothetical protein A4X06_0g5198 [Tilletia controversa]CAD6941447.1 unnamed protein product [Tilletia caries]